jgi:MFS family permease
MEGSAFMSELSTPVNLPLESDFAARKLRIAAVCLIGTTFGSYMAVFGALAFLMLPITKEFHWTRLEFSYAISTLMWSGAITTPLLGRCADRFGVRPVCVVVTTFLGVVTVLIGRVTGHAWTFFLCLALVGVFGQTTVIFNKVLGALFTQHRGKALGAFHVVYSLLAAILPQITTALLTHLGWRGVFITYGVAVFPIVPLLYFGLEEPGSSGPNAPLRRAKPGRLAALSGSPAALVGMTAGEARKDKTFWILVGASLSATSLAYGWVQHHVAFLAGRGFTPGQVANVISISFLFLPLAIILSGYMLDRIQTAKIAAPFVLLGAIGMSVEWLAWPHFGGVPLLLLAVILCGFALGSIQPIQTYLFTRYFGMKEFAEIFGLCMAIQSLAFGFGPLVVGKLFDLTGSYGAAVLVIALGYVLSAGLILSLGPYRYSLDLVSRPE